jgi:hypothetical protein
MIADMPTTALSHHANAPARQRVSELPTTPYLLLAAMFPGSIGEQSCDPFP